jgi:cytochrome P450
MGERFAMTESLCILANIVRKYEILLPDELNSLPPKERKEKLLQWVPKMTITPQNAHVIFRRRY